MIKNTFILAITGMLAMSTGCHAKFKKAAPGLGQVKTKTFGAPRPTVDLGGSDTYTNDNLLDNVVSAYQMGREAELERKIIMAVDPESVGWALEDGVANGIGDGPPFAWTGDKGRNAVLQLEIQEYGIRVPNLGAQGEFTYVVKMRIYTADADRVYSGRIRCEAPIGDPKVFSRAFGGVNNVRQIKQMSDGELQQAFETMASYCGDRIAARLRKHAG